MNKVSKLNFLKDRCPICGESLILKKDSWTKAAYAKECPNEHYCKEYHPLAETVIHKNTKC
ncbi:hypothetical protein [Bacillus sp. REN3]|uniref:hypothetical protein n=1 Tax=Bacillus sp. REN3 TaxID=2802440 RepID=UPI001AED4CC8|nr:hypothetical protein [Bacillus sp. REN3]